MSSRDYTYRDAKGSSDEEEEDARTDSDSDSDHENHNSPKSTPTPPPTRSYLWLAVGAIFLLVLVGVVFGTLFATGTIKMGGVVSSAAPDVVDTSGGGVTGSGATRTAPSAAGGGGVTGTRATDDTPTSTPTRGNGSTQNGQGNDEGDEGEGDDTTQLGGGTPTGTRGSGSNGTMTTTKPKSTTTPSTSTGEIPTGATELLIDFTTFTTGSVSSFLSSAGMTISDWQVGENPLPHTFTPDNVAITNGALALKVTGGATNNVISAEVVIDAEMMYGSVTTRAKASSVKGVCHGIFWYKDGENEVDIEILTSYITEGIKGTIPAGLELTNHGSNDMTNQVVPFSFDPTADFHDYTIVWAVDKTEFLVDGELLGTITENVPTKPMLFMINNWSNGNVGWAAGPPTEDNILLIEKISGWYTTA